MNLKFGLAVFLNCGHFASGRNYHYTDLGIKLNCAFLSLS